MGIKIKVARVKKLMSQDDLCKRADISRATLSNLEQGKGNPSRNLMLKLSSILETPVVELFFEE